MYLDHSLQLLNLYLWQTGMIVNNVLSMLDYS